MARKPTFEELEQRAKELEKKVLELERAEKELRKNNETLSQIVQGSPIPIFAIDKKHIITHWNKACENLTGISANEIIGTQKQFSPFYSVERPVMADLLVDNMPEEEISTFYSDKFRESAVIEEAYESEDFFPDFREKGNWFFLTAAPLRDAEGKVIGAVECLQDITERKQLEEMLRDSEKKYRLISENVTDVIWVMDLKQLRITYNSPSIERLRGYTPKEAIDIPLHDTLAPASLELAMNVLNEELTKEKTGNADPLRSRTLELEQYCKDGSTVWTEITMRFLRDDNGQPTGVLCVTRDIAKRKQAEEALRESEKRYRELSITDDLTMLHNSRHFFSQLKAEIRNRPVHL
jgi:PAS domain S-box-containing protein